MQYEGKDLLNLVYLFEALNTETKLHSFSVANYTKEFAKRYGIEEGGLFNYYLYGLYHDIGKSKVSLDILEKDSNLTDDEYNIIKKHTIYGNEMVDHLSLSDSVFKNKLLDVITHHHERIDGTGYPEKIKDLSLECKIVSVADTCDAILSKRCYKDKKSTSELITILDDVSGSQLDSDIVSIAKSYFK